MMTLTSPHRMIDLARDGELAKPISAISTIRQDGLKKPVLLGVERDPTMYSTLLEFGFLDDDVQH
jgi:hypothetical protein